MSLRAILAAFGIVAPGLTASAAARQEMMRRFSETVDRHAAAAQRVVQSAEVRALMVDSNPDAEDVKRLENRRADVLDAWVKGQDADGR